MDIVTLMVFSVDIIILEMINSNMLPREGSLIMYLGTFFYLRYRFSESFVVTVKRYLLAIFIIAILQFGVGTSVFALIHGRLAEDATFLIINTTISLIVIFSTFLKNKENSDYIIGWISRHKALAAYIVMWLAIGIIVFKTYGQLKFVQTVGLFVFGSTILVVIVIWQKERISLEKEKSDIYKENEYKSDFGEMINDIRRKQHDFDNHINAISGMYLTVDNMEELANKQEIYRRQMLLDNKYNKIANENSSPVIIGFLYNKFLQIEDLGVEILPHIVIGEAECKITQIELVEILGILIDNSVEAVLSDDASHKLKIEIVEYKDKIVVEVSNPHPPISQSDIGKFFEQGYSTKGDGRGLGLYKVKKLLENNKGIIFVDNKIIDKENWFLIKIEICK